MVLIFIDVSSKIGAHVWSEIDRLYCLRQLYKSRAVSNLAPAAYSEIRLEEMGGGGAGGSVTIASFFGRPFHMNSRYCMNHTKLCFTLWEPWYLCKMVNKNKLLSEINFKFATAVDLNKSNRSNNRDQSTCAKLFLSYHLI